VCNPSDLEGVVSRSQSCGMKKFFKAFAIALVILAFLIDGLNYSFMQIQVTYLHDKKVSYGEYRFPSLYYLVYPSKKANRYYIRFIKEGFGDIVTSNRVDTPRLIEALQNKNLNPHRYLDELLYIWNAQLAPFNAINSKQELKNRLYNYDPINKNSHHFQRTARLHQAKDKESIDALLLQGATINDLNRQKQHILHFVQDIDLAQYIISLGASINYPDIHKNTPIIHAIQNYQKTKNQAYWEIIKLFLQNHADTRKALRITYDIEIAKLLLSYDANVNEVDIYGHTVLHDLIYLAQQNPTKYQEVIGFLIDNGANINHTDNIQRSLLHKTTRPDIITLLLDKGIDTTLRNCSGQTAYENWLSHYEGFKKYPQNIYNAKHHKTYYDAIVAYENYLHLPKKIKKFEQRKKFKTIS